MNVVMIASESLPFVKVGGLGDVVYSLSKNLVKKGVKVSILVPFYKCILSKNFNSENLEFFQDIDIKMSWRKLKCSVYKYKYENITYYFLGNSFYYDRDEVYGYDDDYERFAFFQLAAYELIRNKLGNIDIVHLHDWQSSAVSLLHHHRPISSDAKFILTIHNPAFQGIGDREDLYQYFNLPTSYFDEGLVRLDNKFNLIKSAIMLVDKITTVSPTHAKELKNGFCSYRLEKVLPYRDNDFIGILNGIDYQEFNPNCDEKIYQMYNNSNFSKYKSENKKLFCKEFDIENENYPIFSIVSRLTYQKGMDILIDNLPTILSGKLNVVVLGKGNLEYEQKLIDISKKYTNLKIFNTYSDLLAHKIYASSDFLLMPSLFEPCGISQMIAMRYGTIPIASRVGGLIDTIVPYNKFNIEEATGLLMASENDSFINNLLLAQFIYDKKRTLNKIRKNGMKKDFSWKTSCKKYLELYQELLKL